MELTYFKYFVSVEGQDWRTSPRLPPHQQSRRWNRLCKQLLRDPSSLRIFRRQYRANKYCSSDSKLLALYIFAAPSSAKYLAQFIDANLSVTNHIPINLLGTSPILSLSSAQLPAPTTNTHLQWVLPLLRTIPLRPRYATLTRCSQSRTRPSSRTPRNPPV